MFYSIFEGKTNEEKTQTEDTTIDEGVLDFSIETASSTVLRVLLRSICETFPEAKTKVAQHLLVAKNLVPVVPEKDPLSDHSDSDEDSESDNESVVYSTLGVSPNLGT
ncbi:hypothetical protein N7490_010181 [Penicillium lividum]|nr:hypothetical protein N7490_010181 [Penicillium lividum]